MLLANSVVASCLEYEPNIIEISGTLVHETHPGRPNYESIKNGDMPVTIWVIKIIKPVCAKGRAEVKMTTGKAGGFLMINNFRNM